MCYNCDMDCMAGGRYSSYCVCCIFEVEVHLCTDTHIPDQEKTPSGTGPEELCPNSLDPAYSSPDWHWGGTQIENRKEVNKKWAEENRWRNPERENMHVNKRGGLEGAIRSAQNNSLQCFESNLRSPHPSMWTCDACFACFHEYRGTTKYTSFQTFLRVRSVLFIFHRNKKIWSDCPFKAASREARFIPEHRGKAMIFLHLLIFTSSMCSRRAYRAATWH